MNTWKKNKTFKDLNSSSKNLVYLQNNFIVLFKVKTEKYKNKVKKVKTQKL